MISWVEMRARAHYWPFTTVVALPCSFSPHDDHADAYDDHDDYDNDLYVIGDSM